MIVPLRQKTLVPPLSGAEEDAAPIKALAQALACPSFVAEILLQKGVDTVEAAQEYFFPTAKTLRPCCGIMDLVKAVDLLEEVRASGEKIAVHGDYDVDGVTGTALLCSVLRECGFAEVLPVLPNRFNQGYGLCEQTVRNLHSQGVKWILTVDTGIGAIPEVRLANSLGLKVLICDHHQQGDELPEAMAVVNPNRRECTYQHKQLSGVAVAWKLSEHLMARILGRSADSYLDLVALGTLADLMPLADENRYLVKVGLKALVRSQRPGLRLLVEESHLDLEFPRAQDVLFRITPMLNAAGRMGSPELALDFLMSEDLAEAKKLLAELKECNKERRMWEAMMVREAIEMVEADESLLDSKVLVVASPTWNQGVIGIVAARLIERFHRPVAVISVGEDGQGRASCRSAAGFNWLEALDSVADLLLRYGGHCHASGFTVDADLIPELRRRLKDRTWSSGLLGSVKSDARSVYADYSLGLDEVCAGLMQWLQRLEPFGAKNPAPIFYASGVRLEGVPRQVGADHLRMRLRHNGKIFDAIAFQQRSSMDWLKAQKSFALAFYPVWNMQKPGAKRSDKDIQLQVLAFGEAP